MSKFLRSRGSHRIWSSEDGTSKISIPVHGDTVKVGIVRQVQDAFNNTPSNWN